MTTASQGTRDAGTAGADGLASLFASLRDRKLPPVHLWNPDFCGDIDMRIARDGSWFYMGTPIGRAAMVKLFAGVLRREADGKYYLVTPVEKLGILVDDAPFVAVEMLVEGEGRDQRISLRTNVDDVVSVDADHPLRVVTAEDGQPSPYVLVRDGLEALIGRAVFYDLVDLAVPGRVDGHDVLGVWSGGVFFPLGPMVE